MSEKIIRTVLESRLKTWADAHSPVLTIAFENVPFTPPAGTYLRAFLLRADTDSQDLEGTHRQRVGVFQVSIVIPNNTGPGAGETIAAELDALYPNNLILTSGAVTVQVVAPLSTGPAIQDVDRYSIPVSIRYRSDTI